MMQGNDGAVDLVALETERGRNLRQLLLAAARHVGRDVVDGLHARGHDALGSTHTTLLSNMDLAGGTITETAERAGITKQAMGRLASDLHAAGYLEISVGEHDARARTLTLTAEGQRLMLDSLEVMNTLERQYTNMIGKERFAALVEALQALVSDLQER